MGWDSPSSSSARVRYIIPPHSAYTGRPRAIFAAMSARREALAARAGAKDSGNPPARKSPSTSGRAASARVLKRTSSAPAASRAARFSG